MKNYALLFISLFLFFACDKEDGGSKIVTKQREEIVLTRTEGEIVESNNLFAFNLYREIHTQNVSHANMFISPLSASIAFAMLNNGASGSTQEEIQEILGFSDYEAKDINVLFQKMLEAAIDIDPQVTIETANAVWIQSDFPVLDSFAGTNKEHFDAEVKNVDFRDVSALRMINNWTSDKTHGKIPYFLDEVSSDMQFLLMNALYFLGEWHNPFNTKDTKSEPFTNANKTKVNVPMMNNRFKTYYSENELYSMVNLPYGNGAFQMMVILPHENIDLSTVITALDADNFMETARQGYSREVILKFPRFKSEYEIDLIEVLKAMGLHDPFDPLKADLSSLASLSDVPLYVTMVKQKATIEINEKGTEAAAVSGVGGKPTSAAPATPVNFYVDRPFLYLIRELSTGTIFFMGEVNNL